MKIRLFYVLHQLSEKEIEKLKTRSEDELAQRKIRITYSKKRKVEDVEADSVEDAIRWAEKQRVALPGYEGVYGQFVTVYGAKEATDGARPEPDQKLTFEELLLPL